MKVYGVHSGSRYEGGGIQRYVFKNYSNARREAEELVKAKQEEDYECYGEENITPSDDKMSFCAVDEWEEWREDYWTNGVDEVVIIQLEVI